MVCPFDMLDLDKLNGPPFNRKFVNKAINSLRACHDFSGSTFTKAAIKLNPCTMLQPIYRIDA